MCALLVLLFVYFFMKKSRGGLDFTQGDDHYRKKEDKIMASFVSQGEKDHKNTVCSFSSKMPLLTGMILSPPCSPHPHLMEMSLF